jgi:DNA-binding MarR family transcriptional regulator
MADHVDLVLAQWAAQRPDLDVSPMAVIGRLSRLSRLVGAELNRTFSAHGLDSASFDVLATLRRSDPPHRLTPAELMRASMVTSGAITQRLDRLEARGLVKRSASESDGRGVQVALTDEGWALIDETLPDHVDTEQRVLGALSRAQCEALAGVLRSLLESLGDVLGEPVVADKRGLSSKSGQSEVVALDARALIELVRKQAGSDDPLVLLETAVLAADEAGAAADAAVEHYVSAARAEGLSWTQIGERLGVSKQAARQRFTH